uniref:Bestrophin homolog n=1 Tax=Lepeophtheirus salmonis TaxID=72036 RepID=A0A0K2SXU1_LEPSM
MSYGKNMYANQYQDTSKRCRGSFYLFAVWKNSVFKLIWHEFILFATFYFFISFVYRVIIFENPESRALFEMICVFASRFMHQIPITFLTGFYVSQVVSRWWGQFMTLPWPDKIALKLVTFVPGKALFHKNLRLTVMRYINLSTILVYRLVSLKVKKRFPTHKTLIDAKLMLPHEAERLEKIDARTPHESSWAPLLWANKLLQKARSEEKIKVEPPLFGNLISSFDFIDSANRKILNYGLVNFPLAYTQVAVFSVYCYFLASLFGKQYLIPNETQINENAFPHSNVTFATLSPWQNHTPDFFIPIFTFVEFLSYAGWIKVAETLLNPFGDDDEDFCINYIIDRNLQVSYLIVDVADNDFEMAKDPFLEAGIDIPPMPPHIPTPTGSLKRSVKKFSNNEDEERRTEDISTPSPNKSLYMTVLSGDNSENEGKGSPSNESKLLHHESFA